MFRALTDMLRTPVVIKPFLEVDTYGDKTYSEPFDALCMIEPRLTILPQTSTTVATTTGPQEVSEGVMYLNGDVKITEDDMVVFGGKEYSVKRLWATYEGPRVSMWVVYF